MSSSKFDPATAIPDLSHKIILVTGGTSGIGAETIKYLAAHNPNHIFFTGRNRQAANSLIGSLKNVYPLVLIQFIECDFSSLSSVQQASNIIASQVTRLDLVFGNAGVMSLPPGLSKDGYEQQFAINHLSHALMIDILLPLLLDTAAMPHSDVRIVMSSSTAAAPPLPPPGGIQFSALRTTQSMFGGPLRRYGQSKLANLLYARAIDNRCSSITAVSVHPGIGYTGLQRTSKLYERFLMWMTTLGNKRSPNELAWNSLWAATATKGTKLDQVEGGLHYMPIGYRTEARGMTASKELEDQLWEWTQKELHGWKVKADKKVL